MTVLRYLLAGTLAVTGGIIALGAFRSPMNAEGIFALAFLLLLFLSSVPDRSELPRVKESGAIAAVLAITAIAFIRYLPVPFLSDDYFHIWQADHFTLTNLVQLFTVPAGDRFFRPLGYLSYALDATWAGFSPRLWHGGTLALHLLNTCLVYVLCRRLALPPIGSAAGALLFGIHGSRPEVVAWVASRFDLLAVLFGVFSLLSASGRRKYLTATFLILATLSKESAFMIPALAAALLRFQGMSLRQIGRFLLPSMASAAAVFLFRWHLLGEIGGYHDATNGTPTILQFQLASTAKALTLRFWGALLFPINWTDSLGLLTKAALVLGMAALAYLAWRGGRSRSAWLGFVFATLCSLPVHQFLSIGPDLEKSRVLYFASVGFAILFASLIRDRRSAVAGGCFLLFQSAALEHNLRIWERVAALAKRTCEARAAGQDLPNVVDGVYFLHRGFEECVLMENARPRAPVKE